ncbi:MAG: hypothetical protein ACJAT2_002014 [Bacteriovoracaceae bacterium]|jgi:hypothetical protein
MFSFTRSIHILVVFIFSISLGNASMKPAEIVENFDLRYYHPQLLSLKDLAFEIRVSNLKESVLKSIPLSKLDDLYYSVFWIAPGKYLIEVHGLPKGYVELRNELKALIRNRLDYVLPQKLAPKVRSYSLKAGETKNNLSTVIGTDETHQRGINEIEIKFNKKGMLQSFVTKSPMGSQKSEMQMSSKPWSNNKWVVDSIIVTSMQGVQFTKMKNTFKYKKVDGFGFPEKVTVETTQELQVNNKEKKKRKVVSEITFSNYQVNKGIARKRILDQSAKKQ